MSVMVLYVLRVPNRIILTTNLCLLPLILAIQSHWDLRHFPLLLGNYQWAAFSPVANEWSFIINLAHTHIYLLNEPGRPIFPPISLMPLCQTIVES
jgi:hypothetical protein